MGPGQIIKNRINLDLIEIIQFYLKIYDLLDILDIFLDILLKPSQPFMETKWGQHGDNMGTT